MKRLAMFFSALIALIFISGCNGVNVTGNQINSSEKTFANESTLSFSETNSEADTETSADEGTEKNVNTNSETNNTVTSVEPIDLEHSAVQLIGAYIDTENRVCFDMGSWVEMKNYDLFREYFVGVWNTDSVDLCLLWQKNSPIVIDESEQSALAEYGDFYFTNFYKVSDDVLAFVMNTIGNGLIFWMETDNPDTIYALAIVWTGDLTGLLCLGNMEKEYVLVKTDASPNEASNGFLSVFKLHEMAYEYGVDFDMLVDIVYENESDVDRLYHDDRAHFYPVYLVSESADKLEFKTQVGNVYVENSEIDVSYTIEKINREWTRTVEFDDGVELQ